MGLLVSAGPVHAGAGIDSRGVAAGASVGAYKQEAQNILAEVAADRGTRNITAVVFGYIQCPYCERAENELRAMRSTGLLEGRQVRVIRVADGESWSALKKKTPHIRTLPAVFVGAKYRGGSEVVRKGL